ncbi:VanZ family protein [Brevibacillus ginsengisoli]|uniref:VanZ family protein n=1 Tax=Brevibacillus ginsengisoli TaxID=363854 RepID=UPI003CE958A3
MTRLNVQENKRKRIFIDIILVACFLAGIFFSSSQPYEKQDMRGTIRHYVNMQQVEEKFGNISFQYGKKEISVQKVGPDGFVEFFVRKGTHFLTFAAFGVLFYRLFRHSCQTREALGWAGFVTVMLAVIDEWHQSFTPNRTAMITDVVLDTTGLLFTMLFIAIFRMVKR